MSGTELRLPPPCADPVHDRSPPGIRWSRNNSGEAVPGVLTPMAWAFYGANLERRSRQGFYELGLLPRSAAGCPGPVGERMFGVFHGRFALNAQAMRGIMGALPGVSGDEVERDILGYVPEGVVDEPQRSRMPAIARKMPRQLLTVGGQARCVRREAQAWWERSVAPDGPRAGVDPYELLSQGFGRFGDAMAVQAKTRMVFQAVSSALQAVAERADAPEASAGLLASPAGLEEAAVADELWRVARGEVPVRTFLARHGYHGPNSGDIATRSWREDRAPIDRLLGQLRRARSPAERREQARAASEAAVSEQLGRLSPGMRLSAWAGMRMGSRAAHNLELTKTAGLIALDGARAAARAIGDALVEDGCLLDREDVFFLMPGELLDDDRRDRRDLVAARRASHSRHRAVELPETWTGQPSARPIRPAGRSRGVRRVTGAGVSPGVVEGTARVIMDLSTESGIELGEILVAPTTDPSWVSLMTIAAGLVIDVGTAASHSAIVARELGVPCVIGTKTGTMDLADGARIRIDGSRGTVEVLGAPRSPGRI